MQRRLEYTISQLEKHFSDSKALPLLRKATPQTLRAPRLVYVTVFHLPESIRLWLEWIEARPTPDGILIFNSDTGYEKTICFDQLYVEENRRTSKSMVLFRFVYPLELETDEWERLREAVVDGNARAVLVRKGESVSNEVVVKQVVSSS